MKKKDISNVVALTLIQGSNALFPLFVFPYIFKFIGENNFSKIVTVEVVSFYLLSIVIYSFDVVGVRNVMSALESGRDRVSREFSLILISRLFLWIIASSTLLIFFYFFLNDLYFILIAWLFFPLGMILQSNYYFQAVERNFVFSVVIFLSRFFSCFLVFVIVKSEQEMLLAVYLVSMSYFFSGLMSLFYAICFEKVRLSIPRMEELFSALNSGKSIFWGNLSILLFRGSNVLILSLVTQNPAAVSYYSLAEKYTRMVQAVSRPLNQHFFPKAVSALRGISDRLQQRKILWTNTKVQLAFIVLIVISFDTCVFIDTYYFHLFFTENIFFLLLILTIAPVFGIFNYMFVVARW